MPGATVKAVRKRRSQKRGALVASSNDDTTAIPWQTYSRADPFPPRRKCTLVYTASLTCAAGASGLFGTEQGFRLNSLYDPDYVNVGHQPYMFDQMALIYTRYRVNATSIDLTFSDPSADGVCCAAQVKPNSATGGVSNLVSYLPDQVRERPNVAVGFLNNTGSQKVHMKRRFTIPQAEGLKPAEFLGALADYSALTTANPSKTPYLQIAVAALDGSSTPTVRLQVRLAFECEFWERLIVAQS